MAGQDAFLGSRPESDEHRQNVGGLSNDANTVNRRQDAGFCASARGATAVAAGATEVLRPRDWLDLLRLGQDLRRELLDNFEEFVG
jgi:hypothetical protein